MQSRFSIGFQLSLAVLAAALFFRIAATTGQDPKIENPSRELLKASQTNPLAEDSAAQAGSVPVAEPPPPLPPVDPIVIEHGPRSEKCVALTFDACSTDEPSQYDDRVTQALIASNTPATLFLGGKWMKEEPEQTKLLGSNPLFELANHTYFHPHLVELSDDSIRQEILSAQALLYALTGKQATLFRPPFGEWNARVVAVAANAGLKTVQFDLASGDPDPAISKQRLVQYVSSMARNGSIIVMHINRRGWHTAEALPEIIARLRQRGFTFKTVSDLIAQTDQR